MSFLLGLAVGLVAGGAIAYIWHSWFQKTADDVAGKITSITTTSNTDSNTTPTV